MDPLERLDWAAGISVTSFGVKIGIRVDDPKFFASVQTCLPPGYQPSDSAVVDHLYSVRAGGDVPGTRVRRFFIVYSSGKAGGCTRLVRTLHEREALTMLEGNIRWDLAMSAAGWTFVHAGAVAWKGRAIVIPGASGYGKSRLVEALVRAGATYYSDEYAVFDSDGRLHPFAKPIMHREATGDERSIPVAELGGAAGTRPVPIGLIVDTRYDADATWHPRRGSAGEGLFALLPHTFRVPAAPGQAMGTLARAVEGACVVHGPRGEADRVARELFRLVENS